MDVQGLVIPAMSNTASSAPLPPTSPDPTSPDETVEDFAERASEWLERHRSAAPPDYGAICPPDLIERGRQWQRLLFAEGFAGIDWPVEFGGLGLTPTHRGAWVRACALAGVPPFLNMVGTVLAGGSTMLFGTHEQKAEHLRPILAAEHTWCQLFSEPGAGSDLASLSTKAELDGDEWVITGQKVWCSGGRYSDRGILLARTDQNASKHKGISFFLFDMTRPGVDVRPLRQMTGEAEFDEVFLDEVRIPAASLLGPLHAGWNVAMATLTNERGSIGSAAISLSRRMDKLAETLRREAGDDVDGATRDALVRIITRGRVLAMLGARQGPVASTAASLGKLGITELMFASAEARTSLAGADAMLQGNEAARSLIAAPGARIAGGSSQIQRNLIGERLLGLPAEPRPSLTEARAPEDLTRLKVEPS